MLQVDLNCRKHAHLWSGSTWRPRLTIFSIITISPWGPRSAWGAPVPTLALPHNKHHHLYLFLTCCAWWLHKTPTWTQSWANLKSDPEWSCDTTVGVCRVEAGELLPAVSRAIHHTDKTSPEQQHTGWNMVPCNNSALGTGGNMLVHRGAEPLRSGTDGWSLQSCRGWWIHSGHANMRDWGELELHSSEEEAHLGFQQGNY